VRAGEAAINPAHRIRSSLASGAQCERFQRLAFCACGLFREAVQHVYWHRLRRQNRRAKTCRVFGWEIAEGRFALLGRQLSLDEFLEAANGGAFHRDALVHHGKSPIEARV